MASDGGSKPKRPRTAGKADAPPKSAPRLKVTLKPLRAPSTCSYAGCGAVLKEGEVEAHNREKVFEHLAAEHMARVRADAENAELRSQIEILTSQHAADAVAPSPGAFVAGAGGGQSFTSLLFGDEGAGGLLGGGGDPAPFPSEPWCERVIEGHPSQVWALTLLGGGLAAAAAGDKTIRIVSLADGRLERTLVGHAGLIWGLAGLPGGRLASASADKTVRVWRLADGQCERTMRGHGETCWSVAVVDGGRAPQEEPLLASGSADKTVRLWRVEDGSLERMLTGHTDQVWSVCSIPGGRLASGSGDHTIRIWHVADGACEKILEGHTKLVRGVAALGDGRVVSASFDLTLRVWRIDDGVCEQVLEGHGGLVRGVIALGGGRAISYSEDKTLRVWSCDRGICVRVLSGHSGVVYGAGITEGGALLVHAHLSPCRPSLLHGVWDSQAGKVVSGSADRTLRIWDVDDTR